MRKITFVLVSMLLLIAAQLKADCPVGKLASSSDRVCPNSVITISALNTTQTDYAFEWDVKGGTIVAGYGTNAIQVKWKMSGEKYVKLAYKQQDGCKVEGNIAIEVLPNLTVAGLALAKDIVCEGEVLQKVGTPVFVDKYKIYEQGVWTLNHEPFNIDAYPVKTYDDGKYVRVEYKSTVDYCPDLTSNAVRISVKDLPLIRKITMNDTTFAPTTKVGDKVKLYAEISSVTSKLDTVIWYLHNDPIATGATAWYTVKDSSYDKTIRVDATNACGTTSSTRTVIRNTNDLEAPGNPTLDIKGFDNSKDFMVRPLTANDAVNAPSNKYWESKTNTTGVPPYQFWTQNKKAYDGVQFAYFKRNADGTWVESKEGADGDVYKFHVNLMPTTPALHKDIAQNYGVNDMELTVLVDEGTYYVSYASNAFRIDSLGTNIPSWKDVSYNPADPGGPTPGMYDETNYTTCPSWNKIYAGYSSGASCSLANGLYNYYDDVYNALPVRKGLKMFGKGQVIVKVADNAYDYDPNVPMSTALDQFFPNVPNAANIDLSINDGACENFIVDLNNIAPTRDNGIGIQTAGGMFIVKNITVRNAVNNAPKDGETFNLIRFNNLKPNEKEYRYFSNIRVEDSKLTGSANSSVGVFGISGVQNTYIKNLTSDNVELNDKAYSLLFNNDKAWNYQHPGWNPAGGGGYGVSDIINLTIDGIQDDYGRFAIFSRNDTFPVLKDVTIPDGYRYMDVSFGKYPRIEIVKDLPGLDTTHVVYDMVDGYFIFRSEQRLTPQFSALKEFYEMLPIVKGAPLPNIKIAANEDGVVEGFEMRDLGVKDNVNLFFVPEATSAVTQDQFVPYLPGQKIYIESSASQEVSLYNIDFATLANLSAIDILNQHYGIRFGSLYNSKIADYLPDAFMVINKPGGTTAIDQIDAAKVVVIYPNPFNSEVSIESAYDIKAVRVVDMNGRQVYANQGGSTSVIIPAGAWSTGAYIVIVETTEGNYVRKIVKN